MKNPHLIIGAQNRCMCGLYGGKMISCRSVIAAMDFLVKHANLTSSAAATAEVVSWAQCVLTALNVGDVQSGSELHLKLREALIAYRASMTEQQNEIKILDEVLKPLVVDLPSSLSQAPDHHEA